MGALDQAALTAARHAERSERERRLAPEVVEALAGAGLFRMLVPESLGGGEVSPAQMVDAIATVARGDGAAGWCVAVACTSGALAAYLPEGPAREVYGGGARCWGGVFAPKGRAGEEGDSLRVTGRWPFASGIDHCDWLMGGCVIERDGEVRKLPSGRPDVRLVLFPADDVERIDTWHVAGLSGTGSHDMAVDDLLVPAARSASLFADAPRERGALYAFPIFGLLSLAIASVGLGIARGAVDDLLALAGSKTPSMGTPHAGRAPGHPGPDRPCRGAPARRAGVRGRRGGRRVGGCGCERDDHGRAAGRAADGGLARAR